MYILKNEHQLKETGFENKNLRVLKEILLPRIIHDFEAQSCAMGKIFPRPAAEFFHILSVFLHTNNLTSM